MHQEYVHAVRASADAVHTYLMYVQTVVDTYLFCNTAVHFFQHTSMYVRVSAVQFVRMSLRSTYWTAVGIVRVRTVGTVAATVGTFIPQ